MADTFFIEGLNTLPEQVQINKDDIKSNTSDIAKLKDDIGKIKPNAWEERKFNVDMEGTPIEFTTYNPITDSNTPVNIQKSFIDKETYSLTDKINSFSFSVSSPNIFAYLVCGNPSLTLNELFGFEETAKNYILFANTDVGEGEYWLLISCRLVDTFSLFTSSLSFDRHNNDIYIDKISTSDDKQEHSMLTAKAVDQYYLKKTDAFNTYVTKQEYNGRYDTGKIELTENGFNKIKTMAEEVGTTVELMVTTDFTENVQSNNTNELKLNVFAKTVVPIYRNIHLVPNQTIDDFQGSSESTWYTGNAILSLPSQDTGHFAISYQKGVALILTLICHF